MKNIKFAVFKGAIIGEIYTAPTFDQLINKLPKRLKEWEAIKFIQAIEGERKVISIHQEFFDEGMTFEEQVADCLEHNDHEEVIICLHPRNSGVIKF